MVERLAAQQHPPFVAGAFDWSGDEVPDNWKHVAGWHADVLASSGIRPAADDADEVFRAASANARHLDTYLAHHAPFHERLRLHALAPAQA